MSVPIDSEVLKELVRKAFGLNVNMHKFYMKKIERKNAPKTPERVSKHNNLETRAVVDYRQISLWGLVLNYF